MKKPTKAWGLDIGFWGLKAICVDPDGKVLEQKVYDGGGRLELSDHWVCLTNLVSDFNSNLQRSKIAIGVSSNACLERRIKLPPIDKVKLQDIVRYEAKQQIPFDLEDVCWDWQIIHDAGQEGPFVMECEVLLQARKKSSLEQLLKTCTILKLRPDIIQSNTMALTNALLLDHTTPEWPSAVVSVGAESSVIVVANDRILWSRSIPIGGNHFTKAIAKYMMVPFSKAEDVKLGNVLQTKEERLVAIKGVIDDLVGEIKRSLMYYHNLLGWDKIGKAVNEIFLIGDTFKIPEIKQQLDEEAKKDQETNHWAGPFTLWDTHGDFTQAYGLAMQALGKTKYTTNFMPPKKSFIQWPKFNLKRFIPSIRIEFPYS